MLQHCVSVRFSGRSQHQPAAERIWFIIPTNIRFQTFMLPLKRYPPTLSPLLSSLFSVLPHRLTTSVGRRCAAVAQAAAAAACTKCPLKPCRGAIAVFSKLLHWHVRTLARRAHVHFLIGHFALNVKYIIGDWCWRSAAVLSHKAAKSAWRQKV